MREQSSGKFFLAMPANKKENRIFDKAKNMTLFEADDTAWEKMEYKQLNRVFRQLPRMAFAKKNLEKFNVSEEHLKVRKEFNEYQDSNKGKKKNEKLDFPLDKLNKLIELYKKVIFIEYGNYFDLDHLRNKRYLAINDFYQDVEKRMYSINFIPISHKKLQELNNENKIYLFEIYSKDFSAKADGKENLHTSYFKLLFDPKNLTTPLIKLSGEAEIFFRPKTKELPVRKDKTGKEITFVNKRKDGSPVEKVLENRRYAENKVFFHCSIVLNFSTPEDKRINSRLNAEIAKNKDDFHIIGIDRGEKHLAYYSVIDKKGKIVETGSFNEINNTNYHKKLVERAGKRDEARKDWKRISNIKELKTGYISQVIRKICDLILKYSAVVILEDLNAGFKRGRSALDFPIYQKLELALAKKLNFLVQKGARDGEVGHPLKALQLTPLVQNFQDINRQTGILFYTTAGYTSTTCPRCGWRKNLYLTYENVKKAKADFVNIKITFEDGKFIFSYTSKTEKLEMGSKGKKKKAEKILERDWKLYSDVARYRGHKNNGVWNVKPYENLTDNFKILFEKAGVNLVHPNITEELTYRGEEFGADFWKSLTFFWNLLCQIRNSNSQEKEDIISCPACHFHSSKSKDFALLFSQNFTGVKEYNGDANGAYNIAKKGSIMLERITSHDKNDIEFLKYPDLLVTQYDWDTYLASLNQTI